MAKIDVPKEELQELYKQMSATKIAKMYNTAPTHIRFLLVKYDIQKPKLRDKSFNAIDDQRIKELHEQGFSALEISKSLGLSYSGTLNVINANTSKSMRVSKKKLERLYCYKGMSITSISKALKISRVSIWRYIKAYNLVKHYEISQEQILSDVQELLIPKMTNQQLKDTLSRKYNIPPEQVAFLLKKYSIFVSKTKIAEKEFSNQALDLSLRELYATKSIQAIANSLGVSKYIARKILAQNNIELRKRGDLINRKHTKAITSTECSPKKKRGKTPQELVILDKETLQKEFLENRNTKAVYIRKELCLKFGVSSRVLEKNLRLHGIRRISFKDSQFYQSIMQDKQRLEELYKSKTVLEIAQEFGVSTNFITKCLVLNNIKGS